MRFLLPILLLHLSCPAQALEPNYLPPSTSFLPAPLAIRYSNLLSIARYEVSAACSPTALSYLAQKTYAPPSCTPQSRNTLLAHLTHALLATQFPAEARAYAAYLSTQRLSVLTASTNASTAPGWAALTARPLTKHLSTDGWNSLGDKTRQTNPLPYLPPTPYIPTNTAYNLRRPLRWQPLMARTTATGGYVTQRFVVPHLGVCVPALALTPADLAARRASSPYKYRSSRVMHKADENAMHRLLQDFFARSRGLTVQQRFLAYWWENKRISLGSFLPYYAKHFNLTPSQIDTIRLAQAVAMHDAIVVGWREKTRLDLVRPTTMICKYYSGEKITVFVSEDVGVSTIDGKDYEPLVPVQAHSEFPSGSALLCSSGLEVLQLALARMRPGEAIPTYRATFKAGAFGFPIRQDVSVRFNSLDEAAASCGEARLWAGVHFPPSVRVGGQLAKGIGEKALKQVMAIAEGRKPDYCPRCL